MDMISKSYVYIHVLLLWPSGAIRRKWITRKERVRRGLWLFWESKVVAPLVSIKLRIILALMARFDLYWPHVKFMSPGKPSRPVTTLSNRTSLLQGGLLEGEWGSAGQRSGQMIAGGQDFISGAGTQVRLSRDFTNGCCMWDPRGHAHDVLVRFFPCRVYTDSNHCDALGYEWPFIRYSHLVVCLVVFDGLD
jgi:hypothetical protein